MFAATINGAGYLEIRTTKVGEDTAYGKIIRLVEEAGAHKALVQKFADRFTAYFLPSAITFVFLTYLISGKALNAIAVLIAACPCAVGLATPLSVVASMGSSARRGLLIKGGLYFAVYPDRKKDLSDDPIEHPPRNPLGHRDNGACLGRGIESCHGRRH